MLFRRRNPLSIGERLRLALWPPGGWRRSVRYLSKRVLRLNASPHAIAAGFAAGVFASFTPFIGFHFILSFIVAFVIGGNLLAAAFGTAVGNPFTFPLIWLFSYRVGNLLLDEEPRDMPAHQVSTGVTEHSMDALLPQIEQLTIGGIPLGIGFGLASYLAIRWAVAAYQRTRRRRLEARRPPGEGRGRFKTWGSA